MSLQVLAEGILRIEHKVDALLKHFKVKLQPMHFIGATCPGCGQPIDYQVDMLAGVVKRKCGCSTGKNVFVLQPLPQPGATRGQDQSPEAADFGTVPDGGSRPSIHSGGRLSAQDRHRR